ncbi:metal-binding protein [Mesorhizobium sp. L-8-10]|uniref:DUF411 domain-containing protein n=1 Tax=Mesorhizobium sp. L-8-10 TaxID=2744523 RepID=UPI0019294192|nr:DUF411 domain-containing protein [Mesorhizobium sp. L-8-10]BCH30173.1 metal-binding protein [Mesorhizobium sp. L-8-10]
MRRLGLMIAFQLAVAGGAIAGELVTVYKSPFCGCCESWSEALQGAGYTVERHDMEDLSDIKKTAGVPADLEACHTARIGDYFVEGHVPLEAIAKLMSERPDIAGIAVPGMPQGSLGMGDDPAARYEVYAISKTPGEKPQLFYRVGD